MNIIPAVPPSGVKKVHRGMTNFTGSNLVETVALPVGVVGDKCFLLIDFTDFDSQADFPVNTVSGELAIVGGAWVVKLYRTFQDYRSTRVYWQVVEYY